MCNCRGYMKQRSGCAVRGRRLAVESLIVLRDPLSREPMWCGGMYSSFGLGPKMAVSHYSPEFS